MSVLDMFNNTKSKQKTDTESSGVSSGSEMICIVNYIKAMLLKIYSIWETLVSMVSLCRRSTIRKAYS